MIDNDIDLLDDLDDMDWDDSSNKTREFTVYQHPDPMKEYSDAVFKSTYRLTKQSAEELALIIGPMLPPPPERQGRRPIPVIMKLLITLQYLAGGNFQQTTALMHGYCQTSVSNAIAQVVRAIASLAPEYIKFPGPNERVKVATGFYEMITKRYPNAKAFPRVIGCVDGTQIQMLAKGLNHRENFRNRKGVVSLNVQAICDHELNFTNLVCRWQGSAHDARVFKNCSLYGPFERGEIDGWLLGDSGYFNAPYLLTPFLDPRTPAQRAYQFAHVQTRNSIERAFGILKRRFQVIGPDGGMIRLDINNGTSLAAITSCFVLHNFLRKRHDFFERDIEAPALSLGAGPIIRDERTDGADIRDQVVAAYFS
jgi:hypothetical protein